MAEQADSPMSPEQHLTPTDASNRFLTSRRVQIAQALGVAALAVVAGNLVGQAESHLAVSLGGSPDVWNNAPSMTSVALSLPFTRNLLHAIQNK